MLKLVIGDKNLSSWSLRPWLLLRHLGLAFEEIRLPLDTPRFRDEIGRYSPARRVPVLLDGELRVWDSLAICEYLDEKSGGRAWPREIATRAHARSASAEMHSGFTALRTAWSMRAATRGIEVPPGPAVLADIERIDEIWSSCRAEYAADGPWLFGRYCVADAMYAPVVLRFNTYGAQLSAAAGAYFATVLQDQNIQDWIRDAGQEVSGTGRSPARP